MTSADDADHLPDGIRATLADGWLPMVGGCEGFGECISWLVDPVTGVADKLVAESVDDPSLTLFSVAASPDGRIVAALVHREGAISLELIDPDTRAVRSIPLPDLRPTLSTRVRWLTDGRIPVNGDRDHPRRYQVITLPPEWRPAG